MGEVVLSSRCVSVGVMLVGRVRGDLWLFSCVTDRSFWGWKRCDVHVMDLPL